MKKILTSLSILTVLIAGVVHAVPRSHSEVRGLETCVDAAKAEFAHRFVSGRTTYFIDRNGPANTYFINAGAWQAGERVPLRIACETSPNGRKLLSYSSAPGSFIPQPRTVSSQVAANRE